MFALDWMSRRRRGWLVQSVLLLVTGCLATALVGTTEAEAAAPPSYGSVVVSCARPTFCMAVYGKDDHPAKWYRTFDGVQWSARRAFPDINYTFFLVLSCASPTFCGALVRNVVTNAGPDPISAPDGYTRYVAWTWNGATWRKGRSFPSTSTDENGITFLGCADIARPSCMGVDDDGRYLQYAYGHWLPVGEIAVATGTSIPLAGSCSARNDCLLLTSQGWERYDFAASVWVLHSDPVLPGVLGISCHGPSKCVALGSDRDYANFRLGQGWSAPHRVRDPGLTYPYSLACGSVNDCIAMSDGGDYSPPGNFSLWSFRSGRWFRSGSPERYVTTLSCAGAGFCMAGNADDKVVIERSHQWGTPTALD